MADKILRTCVAAGVVSLGLLGTNPVARAGITVDSSVRESAADWSELREFR